jgi:galactose mutarotase-like enzyme
VSTTAAPSATVEEVSFRGEPALRLSAGELSATFLPRLGMTGVSMRCRGREHFALPGGLAALRSGATLGLPLLAPWANRLAAWRYRAAGVDVDLTGRSLGTDSGGLPIHGLLVGRSGWHLAGRTARADRAGVRAAIEVDDPAFPFPHRIEVSATVRDCELAVETTIVPTGRRRVPVAFGWHPYLRLPGTPRRHWTLRLPARAHVALDGRGIPTGAQQDEAGEDAPIGRRTFDDLYLLGRDRDLALVGSDATVTMRAGPGYAFAQVWVPKGRAFAALEPMTARTNCLVDGTAPLVEPGGSHRAAFSITVGPPP